MANILENWNVDKRKAKGYGRFFVKINVHFGIDATNEKDAIAKVRKMVRGFNKEVKSPTVITYGESPIVREMPF